MDNKKLFQKINTHLEEVSTQKGTRGRRLWNNLIAIHPADIAQFLSTDKEVAKKLFPLFDHALQIAVFNEVSHVMKAYLLGHMTETEQAAILNQLPSDDLTDLFDYLSDQDLKRYLNVLYMPVRDQVLALRKFPPESAGGIMHVDVMVLREALTVEKSISLIQRLSPRIDLHRRIYVIDKDSRLVGYINLEDLVLQRPHKRIRTFMHKNEFVAYLEQDQEEVAKQMIHYGLITVPVIDKNNHIFGVISGETLVDVIVEETSEDIQKMSALTPMKYPYFETPFLRILWERSYILVILLLAESFSSNILSSFEKTLSEFLLIFIPMLISAGGNTSSQTSAMVIQGLAAGDITFSNMFRLMRREFAMGIIMALILGTISYIRVIFTGGSTLEGLIIALSLSSIVLISTILGSGLPLLLQRLRIDPAFSAGPFLATIMDIIGILIFCYFTKYLLF